MLTVSSTDKIGIGMVGCGAMGTVHNLAYASLQGVEVRAVCDIEEAKAESFARRFGVKKWYRSYKDLVKDKAVDAVDVCTYHSSHGGPAIAAAEAGKHVAVQKPFAYDVKDAEEMVRAARKAGVKITVDEPEVFYAPITKAKEIVDEGKIGKLIMMLVSTIRGARPPAPGGRPATTPSTDWKRDVRTAGGGSIFDTGWHRLSIAYWFLGEPSEVQAYIETPLVDRQEPFDMMMWKCDQSATYGFFRFMRQPNMYVHTDSVPLASQLEFNGTDGTVWVNRGSEGRLLKNPSIVLRSRDGSTTDHDVEEDYLSSFRLMKREWIECLTRDKRPRITGEDGVKIERFVLAAYKSGKERRPVSPSTITDWDWVEYYTGMVDKETELAMMKTRNDPLEANRR